MKMSTACPCCSNPLLHHVSNHREYWFCRHCWQEMPNMNIAETRQYQVPSKTFSLPVNLTGSVQHLLTG